MDARKIPLGERLYLFTTQSHPGPDDHLVITSHGSYVPRPEILYSRYLFVPILFCRSDDFRDIREFIRMIIGKLMCIVTDDHSLRVFLPFHATHLVSPGALGNLSPLIAKIHGRTDAAELIETFEFL